MESVPPRGALVVEVSSYQLEDVERFHARAAAILNVTPDHLDRYDSFEHYAATKLRIFDRQTAGDAAILPAADPRFDRLRRDLRERLFTFGSAGEVERGAGIGEAELTWREDGRVRSLIALADLPLPGPHNHRNVAAALCLLRGLGHEPWDPRVREALRNLRPLAHRLEPVGVVGDVAYFNDSKATNPDSLEVALQSFERPVVLIAGGLAKESDYERLTPLIARRVAAVVLIGEAAEALAEAWAEAAVPLHHAGTDFEAAVAMAHARARETGALVLLSPGCASFDMFRDFEERGNRFRAAVDSLRRRA